MAGGRITAGELKRWLAPSRAANTMRGRRNTRRGRCSTSRVKPVLVVWGRRGGVVVLVAVSCHGSAREQFQPSIERAVCTHPQDCTHTHTYTHTYTNTYTTHQILMPLHTQRPQSGVHEMQTALLHRRRHNHQRHPSALHRHHPAVRLCQKRRRARGWQQQQHRHHLDLQSRCRCRRCHRQRRRLRRGTQRVRCVCAP